MLAWSLVIGIDINASVVSNAYQNVEIHSMKKCKFVHAKVEDVLGSLLREYLNVP